MSSPVPKQVGTDGDDEGPSGVTSDTGMVDAPTKDESTVSQHSAAGLATEHGDQSKAAMAMKYLFDENLFGEAPTDAQPAAGTGEVSYHPPSSEELLPPPDFKPFFTLIEEPETSEYHHPTVHYIFSDDEPEIMTNAMLEALNGRAARSQSLSPHDPPEERFVILDMAADGKSVLSASSLSADWQALQTSIAQAPSWGEDAEEGDKRMLLKISGHKNMALPKTSKKQKGSKATLEELVARFGSQLDNLDQVMGGA